MPRNFAARYLVYIGIQWQGREGGDPEIFERVLNAYRYIWAEVIRGEGIKEAPPLPISVSGYAGGLGASMLFDAGDNG
jgi:hypothetical protein